MRLIDIDVVIDNIKKDMREEQEKYNELCLLVNNCEKEDKMHTDLLWYFSKCRQKINALEKYYDEQQKRREKLLEGINNKGEDERYRERDAARQGRIKTIEKWIEQVRADKKTSECRFSITTPATCYAENNFIALPEIKEVITMLERNNVKYNTCDTTAGDWILDKVWLETEPMECIIVYTGVYLVNWDMEDLVRLEEMCNAGEIIIRVMVKQDGKWVDNH